MTVQPEYLLQLREEYSGELERNRQEIAKLGQRNAKLAVALQGIDAALELEDERAVFRAPADMIEAPRAIREGGGGDTIKDTIIAEAMRQPGIFTAPSLYEEMRKGDPGINFSTISHALRWAAERGVLRVVEKGAGKRASTYERTQPALALRPASMNPDDFAEGEEENEGAETSEEVSAP